MSDRQTSDEGATKNTPSDYPVIEEPIFWRRSRSVELTPTPPPDKPEPVRRPAKVARQLALWSSSLRLCSALVGLVRMGQLSALGDLLSAM